MLTAFTQRDPYAQCLPSDVLRGLGQPTDVYHGRLLVFAPSATKAWHHLATLDLQPKSQLDLKSVTGPDVAELMTTGEYDVGTVLVLPVAGSNVVEVTSNSSGGRHVYRTGEIRHGRFCASPPALSGADKPEVTEAMLDAAVQALPEYLARQPNLLSSGQLREVIIAALRVQMRDLGR